MFDSNLFRNDFLYGYGGSIQYGYFIYNMRYWATHALEFNSSLEHLYDYKTPTVYP